MKKITLLLLILLSNLFISQNINTPQLTEKQISEVYKGLKQNEYLKERVTQAEKTLNTLQKTTEEQKKVIIKQEEIIGKTNSLLDIQKEETKLLLRSKDIEINKITELNKLKIEELNKASKKKFWKGFTYGGITIGILGTGTMLYFLTK